MKLIGYIREAKIGADMEQQRRKLVAAGVSTSCLFEETYSGINSGRPALKSALSTLKPGDCLVVHSLDRLARSLVDLNGLVWKVHEAGAELRFLHPPEGRGLAGDDGFIRLLPIFAEFEETNRKERQMEGIAKAKENGVKFGRKVQVTPEVALNIRKMRDEGGQIKEIIEKTGLSKASVYRALEQSVSRSGGFEEDEEA